MTVVKIGLVGKPNAGKSTLFSALTHNSAEIASYPFTTIKPNIGLSYFTVDCPETLIGKKCQPREGSCQNGKRNIPVEIIDVPGLIPGASEGKGMGNEFLENVRDSNAIIHVFDASGTSNLDGSIAEVKQDPLKEVEFVRVELVEWLVSKVARDWDKFSRKEDATRSPMEVSLMKKMAGLGLNEHQLADILSRANLPAKLSDWSREDIRVLSEAFFTYGKPILHLANKADLCGSEEIERISNAVKDCIFTSGEYELALQKAYSAGIIDSVYADFQIIEGKATEKQKNALREIKEFLHRPNVERPQDLLKHVVHLLGYLVVYPVFDETHWTDKDGRVLPDAFVMKDGQTALELAHRVHTQIGEGFIKAIDGKTKMVIGKDHKLKEGDVVRVVAKTK